MQPYQTHNHGRQGFTLIELSIVLVIIGLIVGGVLVGQDLIKAAEIRATVGQIEKYNAAANTFRTKYNGIPGDLASPANFGMTATGNSGVNGDSLVQSCTANDGTRFGCETAGFWRHLTQAQLLEVPIGTGAVAAYAAITFDQTNAPPAKIGGGAYIMIGAPGSADTVSSFMPLGFNYFLFSGPTSVANTGIITGTNALTPLQASQIDVKLDDGVATTGTAVAYDKGASAGSGAFSLAAGFTLQAAAANGRCRSSLAGTYNINNAADVNSQLCSLAIRAAF